ncbi:MAG: chemotaxis protein CheW [Spirochaetia bacterium]|jgi:purine-binding chemotaxis protein CheW|nr:chemotaxis protein CheW [Spirochaetia bacterium]
MPAENSAVKGEKYLIFTILDSLYTMPSRFIGEIALFDAVYPLPLLPDYVLGIINRYSTPYALIDIGMLLQKKAAKRAKVLALKEHLDRAAILIDDVVDIVDVAPEELIRIEQEGSGDLTDVIESSFKWNGSDVFVLDIRQILARAVNELGN